MLFPWSIFAQTSIWGGLWLTKLKLGKQYQSVHDTLKWNCQIEYNWNGNVKVLDFMLYYYYCFEFHYLEHVTSHFLAFCRMVKNLTYKFFSLWFVFYNGIKSYQHELFIIIKLNIWQCYRYVGLLWAIKTHIIVCILKWLYLSALVS